MTEQELEQFRKQLQEQKAEFLETLSGSLKSAEGMELDQQRVGRLSRMDAIQSQCISQAANRRIKVELQQIDTALDRIHRGQYGRCQTCDREISVPRLEAYPSAPFCINCAR